MEKPVIEYLLFGCQCVKSIDRKQAIFVTKYSDKKFSIMVTEVKEVIEGVFKLGKQITEYGFSTAYNEAIQQINLIKEM